MTACFEAISTKKCLFHIIRKSIIQVIYNIISVPRWLCCIAGEKRERKKTKIIVLTDFSEGNKYYATRNNVYSNKVVILVDIVVNPFRIGLR
ncbi:MAG: hypothetical protein ACR5KV_08150 [Wolbachia sp.]